MQRAWSFRVTGQPRPKGSWTPYGRGKSYLIRNRERYYRIRDVGLKPANPQLNAWCNAIQWAARSVDPPRRPLVGPWTCHCKFVFRPPQKPAHPIWCIGRSVDTRGNVINSGDGDKLERAVWDALTGIFWKNDLHIAIHGATEVYDRIEPPGVHIVVTFLGHEQTEMFQ